MKKALEGKQPLNQTLTDLSGKTVAGILEYLGLGEAAKMEAVTAQLAVNGWLKIPLPGDQNIYLQWTVLTSS
ncbi:phage tail protein, partial [Enterobacter hormaechei]|nr:phage tail protein [Enterobacter hormaechei]